MVRKCDDLKIGSTQRGCKYNELLAIHRSSIQTTYAQYAKTTFKIRNTFQKGTVLGLLNQTKSLVALGLPRDINLLKLQHPSQLIILHSNICRIVPGLPYVKYQYKQFMKVLLMSTNNLNHCNLSTHPLTHALVDSTTHALQIIHIINTDTQGTKLTDSFSL